MACIIAILLVVGGVELNPGPPNSKQLDEIVQRLEDLSREVRDSRTALTTKFDDMVRDLTTKLNSVELKMATYAQRLDAVEAAQADFTAKLTALQARTITPATGATYAAAAAPAIVPASVNDVVRELNLRAAKRGNIIISGLRSSPAGTDTATVTDLLRTELNINANVTHCSRLGNLLTTPLDHADCSSLSRLTLTPLLPSAWPRSCAAQLTPMYVTMCTLMLT